MDWVDSVSRRQILRGGMMAGVGLLCASQVAAMGLGQTQPFTLSDAEWRSRLSPMQYYVLRRGGTERPFSHALLQEKRHGIYGCQGCGTPLFTSRQRVDSTLGWPSFSAPLAGRVAHIEDHCAGYAQTGIICRNCRGHLGHLHQNTAMNRPLDTATPLYAINGSAISFTTRD